MYDTCIKALAVFCLLSCATEGWSSQASSRKSSGSSPLSTPVSSRRSSLLTIASSQSSTPYGSPERSLHSSDVDELPPLSPKNLAPFLEEMGLEEEPEDQASFGSLPSSQDDSEKKKSALYAGSMKSSLVEQRDACVIQVREASSNTIDSSVVPLPESIGNEVEINTSVRSSSMNEPEVKQRVRIGRMMPVVSMFFCKKIEPKSLYVICPKRSSQGAIECFVGMRLRPHSVATWERQKELRDEDVGFTGFAAMTSLMCLGVGLTLSYPIIPVVLGAGAGSAISASEYLYFKAHPLKLYSPAVVQEQLRGARCLGYECLETYNVMKTTSQGKRFEASYADAVEVAPSQIPVFEDNVFFLQEEAYSAFSQRFLSSVLEVVSE